MNDPVVSPWLIYMLGQVNPWKGFLGASAFLAFCGCIVAWFFVWYLIDDCSKKPFPTAFIGVCATFVSSVLLAGFLAMPNRDTLIAMCVAKNVTPANITKAVDAGKNIKDELVADIVEIIHGKEAEKE